MTGDFNEGSFPYKVTVDYLDRYLFKEPVPLPSATFIDRRFTGRFDSPGEFSELRKGIHPLVIRFDNLGNMDTISYGTGQQQLVESFDLLIRHFDPTQPGEDGTPEATARTVLAEPDSQWIRIGGANGTLTNGINAPAEGHYDSVSARARAAKTILSQ